MATCKCCGKKYNVIDARKSFEEDPWVLEHYAKNNYQTLCCECALDSARGDYLTALKLMSMRRHDGEEQCTECGCTFAANPVSKAIDNEFGSGQYNWLCDWTGPLCYTCATENLMIEDENGNKTMPDKTPRQISCPFCGVKFFKEETERYIDQKFGPGRYQNACKLAGPVCWSCAYSFSQEEIIEENKPTES